MADLQAVRTDACEQNGCDGSRVPYAGQKARVIGIKENRIFDMDIDEALDQKRVFDRDMHELSKNSVYIRYYFLFIRQGEQNVKQEN